MPEAKIQDGGEKGNVKDWEKSLDGEATLTRAKRMGRNLRVIAAEHFSDKATNFFSQVIAKEIHNPNQWLFLIEGKGYDVHEIKVAEELAKKNDIPVEDPVINPFTKSVIENFLQTQEGRMIGREAVIALMCLSFTSARASDDTGELSTVLGISEEELSNSIHSTYLKYQSSPNLAREAQSIVFEGCLNISNIISAQVLDFFLRENTSRTNVAIYLGKDHEQIVGIDVSTIPEEMRLNDEQINLLRRAKETARETRTKRIVEKMLGVGRTSPIRKKSIRGYPQKEGDWMANEVNLKSEISRYLTPMNNVYPELKRVILKWGENVLRPSSILKQNYREYIKGNSLQQVWGAAGILQVRVEEAAGENRNLNSEEVCEIKKAFTKAAEARSEDRMYGHEGKELFLLAENIPILEQLIKLLK